MFPFIPEDYSKYSMQVPPHTFELQQLMLRVWREGVRYSDYKGEKVFIFSELHKNSEIARYLEQHSPDITEGLI